MNASDVSAFVSLSGTLLLILGYVHVAALHWYFGIPYAQYFSLSDYLASSINAVSWYLLAAILSTAFVLLGLASQDSVSVQSPPRPRWADWSLHFLGLTGITALVVVFLRDEVIDRPSLLATSLYIWFLVAPYVVARYFEKPIKAWILIGLVYLSFVHAALGVIDEIERVAGDGVNGEARILRFSDEVYFEPQWRVLSVTSSFIILRRHSDGLVRVHDKAELKRIDSVGQESEPTNAKRPEER